MTEFINIFKLNDLMKISVMEIWSNRRPEWGQLNTALNKIEGWSFENRAKHYAWTYTPNPIELIGISKGSSVLHEKIGVSILRKIERSMGLDSETVEKILSKALQGKFVSEKEIYNLGGITNIVPPDKSVKKVNEDWKNQSWYKEYEKTLDQPQKDVSDE